MRHSKTLLASFLFALLVLGEFADAGNVAVGRSGSMRPGKRTLALGRFNFRPGKRSSLALGRFNFRPGKRAIEEGTCSFNELTMAAAKVEALINDLEMYSKYLESCSQDE